MVVDGSGSTESMICRATGWCLRPSTSMILSTNPSRVIVESVTIVTLDTSSMLIR